MAMTTDPLLGSTVPDKSIRSENNFCILFSNEESSWEGPNDDQDDFCCILELLLSVINTEKKEK
jgi:hypothetical protein